MADADGTNHGRINGWRRVDTLNSTMFLALLTAIAWIGIRVVTIEANRFTNTDGLEIWRKLSAMEAQVAGLPARSSPPDWFLEQVSDLKIRLDRIEERLRIHEQQHGMREGLGEPG